MIVKANDNSSTEMEMRFTHILDSLNSHYVLIIPGVFFALETYSIKVNILFANAILGAGHSSMFRSAYIIHTVQYFIGKNFERSSP